MLSLADERLRAYTRSDGDKLMRMRKGRERALYALCYRNEVVNRIPSSNITAFTVETGTIRINIANGKYRLWARRGITKSCSNFMQN